MPAATLTNTTARAAADLLTIRETWGDLLAAIDGPRDRTWPPRDNIDAALRPDDGPPPGRIPLTLREHPAPVNLDALDAATAVERDLFELADRIAEQVQRWRNDADRDDPRRWHLPNHRSATLVRGDGIAGAGSRAHGLHWATVWIEGRLLGHDDDLFAPVPARLADEAAATIRQCARRIDHALERDARVTTVDRPCPYCRGTLVGRATPGAPERYTVECAGGYDCTAPVPVESGRRIWRAAHLVSLHRALEAADERTG